VGEPRLLSFGGARRGLGENAASPFRWFALALADAFSPAASLSEAFLCPSPCPESCLDLAAELLLLFPSMCQLSNLPDWSGDSGEVLRLFRPEGELGEEDEGEPFLEEGGEGGEAGRSTRGDFRALL